MSGTYQVFARKYRPQTFHDVLGQDHVVQTLRNAIEKDRLAHAYLFVGPRGTGKTSTARILAKALNAPGGPHADFDPNDPVCREIGEGNSLDVLEIDGASNNGVEQVRELRDTVKFAPSSGKYKIYYIDEVHMLSTAAFNALLKTLEEPPAHVKFIFATTEPQKILPTIISRCQRFDLRRIPSEIIAKHLRYIAEQEGITLSEPAAFAIAKGAEGGMRDAQSMLDQLVAFCGDRIEEENVLEIFGFNSNESIAALAGMILSQDRSATLQTIHRYHDSGKDLSKLLADVIGHMRNVLVYRVDPAANMGEIAPEIRSLIEQQSVVVDSQCLLRVIDVLAETDGRMKWASNKRLHLEVGAIKAMQTLAESSIDDLIRLVAQAAQGASGIPWNPPAQPAAGAVASPAVSASPVGRETGARDLPPAPVAAPAAQPQPAVAAPAPASPAVVEEKAPAPRPAPGTLEGAALWEEARNQLSDLRPLLQTWLAAACFLRQGEGEFVIGFSAEQRFFRESLTRHEPDIQAQIRELLGRDVKLVIEVSEDIAPVTLVVEDDEDSPGADSGFGGDAPPWETAAPASGGGGTASAESGPEVPAVTEEDFKNDPLIQEALKVFQARIIS